MKMVIGAFSFLWLICLSSLYAAPTPINDPLPIHEAFAPRSGDIIPLQTIAKAPPSPKVENVPAKPSPDALWIPGYWAWIREQNEYLWVCGVWRRPPPKHHWISGYWAKVDGGFAWIHGFWSSTPKEQLVYIPEPPPNSANENPPAAPGSDYFWATGHWEYDAATKHYRWIGGRWHPFDAKWVLVPAQYIWRPEGFIFNPIYWDFPIDERGEAYSCTNPLEIIQPERIIRRLFVHYPNYVHWYWHWWHFHPGWWDGCWCQPPWWQWQDWWVFNWHDQWGLWWWWGHPGFPQPIWISININIWIFPPFQLLLDFLQNGAVPVFVLADGIPQASDWLDVLANKPLLPVDPKTVIDKITEMLPHVDPILLPKGPKDSTKEIPRPVLPGAVTPDGITQIPETPSTVVDIPEKPTTPAPSVRQPQPQQPSTPQYQPQPSPQTYYPQPNYVPPSPQYTPPNRGRPDSRPRPYPEYTPPSNSRPKPEYTPPSNSRPKPEYTPPTPQYTPPSNRAPAYPSKPVPEYRPPSSSYYPSGKQPSYTPSQPQRIPQYTPRVTPQYVPQQQGQTYPRTAPSGSNTYK